METARTFASNLFLSEKEASTLVLTGGLCSVPGTEDLSGQRGCPNIDNTRTSKRIMLNSPPSQAEEWAEQDHAREMGRASGVGSGGVRADSSSSSGSRSRSHGNGGDGSRGKGFRRRCSSSSSRSGSRQKGESGREREGQAQESRWEGGGGRAAAGRGRGVDPNGASAEVVNRGSPNRTHVNKYKYDGDVYGVGTDGGGAATDGGHPTAKAGRGAGRGDADDLNDYCDKAATGRNGQEAGAGAGASGGGADDMCTGGSGPSPDDMCRPSPLSCARQESRGKCSQNFRAAGGGHSTAAAGTGEGGWGVGDLDAGRGKAAAGSDRMAAGAGARLGGGGANGLRTDGARADGSSTQFSYEGLENGGECSQISGAAGGRYSATTDRVDAGGGGVRGVQAEHRRAVERDEPSEGGGCAGGGPSQLGGAGHGTRGGRLQNTAPPGGGRSRDSEAQSGAARGPEQDFAEWDQECTRYRMRTALMGLRQTANGLFGEASPRGDGSHSRTNVPTSGAAVRAGSGSLEGGGGGGGGYGGGGGSSGDKMSGGGGGGCGGAPAEPNDPEWLTEAARGQIHKKRAMAASLRAEGQQYDQEWGAEQSRKRRQVHRKRSSHEAIRLRASSWADECWHYGTLVAALEREIQGLLEGDYAAHLERRRKEANDRCYDRWRLEGYGQTFWGGGDNGDDRDERRGDQDQDQDGQADDPVEKAKAGKKDRNRNRKGSRTKAERAAPKRNEVNRKALEQLGRGNGKQLPFGGKCGTAGTPGWRQQGFDQYVQGPRFQDCPCKAYGCTLRPDVNTMAIHVVAQHAPVLKYLAKYLVGITQGVAHRALARAQAAAADGTAVATRGAQPAEALMCAACGVNQQAGGFSGSQQKKAAGAARCKSCVEKGLPVEAGAAAASAAASAAALVASAELPGPRVGGSKGLTNMCRGPGSRTARAKRTGARYGRTSTRWQSMWWRSMPRS